MGVSDSLNSPLSFGATMTPGFVDLVWRRVEIRMGVSDSLDSSTTAGVRVVRDPTPLWWHVNGGSFGSVSSSRGAWRTCELSVRPLVVDWFSSSSSLNES